MTNKDKLIELQNKLKELLKDYEDKGKEYHKHMGKYNTEENLSIDFVEEQNTLFLELIELWKAIKESKTKEDKQS
jgi:hypothetical protein